MATMLLCVICSASATAQLLPPDMREREAEVEVEAEILKLYSVEVIVFEYSSNDSADNEIFETKPAPLPPEAEIPVFSDPTGTPELTANVADGFNADARPAFTDGSEIDAIEDALEDVELAEIPSLASIDFRLLEEQELTMTDIHQRLMTLDSYQPVLWGGWIQNTTEQAQALPIHLRMLGSPPIYIDGKLTLYLKNYLHLVVDLTKELRVTTLQNPYGLEQPVYSTSDYATFDVPDSTVILHRITEDRIFRSGHLRYYDHPKFGLLARVIRVTEDDPQAEPENSDDGMRPTLLSELH